MTKPPTPPDNQALHLLQANERLVVALMIAQEQADTTAGELDTLSRTAKFDTLTGLPNRTLMADRIARALLSAKRRKSCLALMFLDLNNFKQINDTHGHATGDEMLRQAAQSFVSSVREADTVCRYSGDEFLILLPEVSQPLDAGVIAAKVLAALALPKQGDTQVLHLSASIGISVYPRDGEDMETLTQRADAAMYLAKKHRLGFVFHGMAVPGEAGPLSAPHTDSPQAAHIEVSQDQHLHLLEANEHLVLAALSAQELQATAERSHRKQGEFLAVLAHELRNPLTPIRTAAALMGMVPAKELPRIRAVIERQVTHLSRLVGDLLDVSRINTGKLRLARRTVDIGRLLEDAVEACRPALTGRLQDFRVHMPSCPLCVDGDPLRLTQVLSNLIDNASKFTPRQGRIVMSIAVNEAENTLVTTVSDSGIGITAEALTKVFEPFEQDSQAPGFDGAGLGVGLMLVRELVVAHGGTVVARSQGSGLGSQFVVSLPRVDTLMEEAA